MRINTDERDAEGRACQYLRDVSMTGGRALYRDPLVSSVLILLIGRLGLPRRWWRARPMGEKDRRHQSAMSSLKEPQKVYLF